MQGGMMRRLNKIILAKMDEVRNLMPFSTLSRDSHLLLAMIFVNEDYSKRFRDQSEGGRG